MSTIAFEPDQSLPGNQSLVQRMRQHTRALHAEAERTGIVAALLRGRTTLAGYALYIRTLLPGYQAMERMLQAADKPFLAGLDRPELYRSAAIEADLCHLAGPSWPDIVPLLESGRAYAQRIESTGDGDGALLLGHYYTRYLGDLLGGQIIGRRIAALFGTGEWSPCFTAFPRIADTARFADEIRSALDRAGRSVTSERIVAEAELAFRMNIAMSLEVSTTKG